LSYAWSLGQATNNQEEEYALLKGIQLAKRLQLQYLNIVGDSKNTIRSLIKGKPQNYSQSNIIKKIHFEISSIHKVSFFHVKRENNSMVDSQANSTIILTKGAINNMFLCSCAEGIPTL
jgi:ribonuclease HI